MPPSTSAALREREEKNGHYSILINTPLATIMEEQCRVPSGLWFSETFIGRNNEEDLDIHS